MIRFFFVNQRNHSNFLLYAFSIQKNNVKIFREIDFIWATAENCEEEQKKVSFSGKVNGHHLL